MKQYFKFTKRCLLLATSLLGISVFADSPSQAATIAFSQGNLLFSNFSHSPSVSFTSTDTNAISISQNGSVASQADAIAYLGVTPPVGFNFTSSQVFGKNTGYLGIGESEAKIQGIFDIDKNTNFSFNFSADLNLATFTDNPQQENASASGNLGFALINLANKDVLDYFQVDGELTTAGNDSLTYKNSKHVRFNTSNMSNKDEFQEFTTVAFDGYLNHYFHNQSTVALVAFNSTESIVNSTQPRVSVPTPSMLPALIFGWGAISLGLKRKRQKSSEACLSEKN